MNYESTTERSGAQPLRAAEQLRASVAEGAQELGDKAASVGAQMRDWWHRQAQTARDAAYTVKDEAVSIGHRTQQYVRDEPAKTAFIVLAAGALISGLVWLATTRRHH